MVGYFGTDAQQHLQRAAEDVASIETTPGACQSGRAVGCDDPEAFGWERIDSFLARDGVFSFRLLSLAQADEVRKKLQRRGYRFDTWDVFAGDRESVLEKSSAIDADGVLGELVDVSLRGEQPEGEAVRAVQDLMLRSGIVPFSGTLLTSAVTIGLRDGHGKLVATAHSYLPHTPASRHEAWAWGGLVAVDESQRGRGLGTYINAKVLVAAFRELRAHRVYELVSSGNIASRKMVEACGLAFDPALICGLAVAESGQRFTK